MHRAYTRTAVGDHDSRDRLHRVREAGLDPPFSFPPTVPKRPRKMRLTPPIAGAVSAASDRRVERPRRLSAARLAPLAVLFALAVVASPASAAVTAAPELIAPISGGSPHNSPLSIEYELPEAGTSATISFVPTTGSPTVVTLTAAAAAAGRHHFFLNLHQLGGETANVKEASATSVPDGEYALVLSYQDLAKDPAAAATAERVKIKTVTSAPVVSEPVSGQTFRKPFTVTYALPEPALPGSVRLLLAGSSTGPKSLLVSGSGESAGSHTVEIVPSDLSSGVGIASATSERLATDSYQLSLSYQDTIGDPAASAVSVTVNVAYPKCEAGTYSASGEEPCVDAPKGSFVATEGATGASECPAGHFAPEEGLSVCLLASPGHYVPASGAKAELECEQGTYNDKTDQSACVPAPFGHYAPKGSVFPIACAAGRYDAHTNSPSAEFCEFDSPGWYSGEGAAEPIPCVPGKYAFAYGSEACLPAPPGSYVSSIGASVVTPCPAGSYASADASVSCTTTPKDTYATGGAGEPTPCPVGMHAPEGASSCAAASGDAASGAASQASSQTSTSASTTAGEPATSPSLVSAAPIVGPTATYAIAATKHRGSLARTRRQGFVLTCSAATTVQVRTTALVSAAGKRLALAARTVTLRCDTAAPTEAAASFKLTRAAKQLLLTRGASVKLSVRVYAAGPAAGTRLASATVRGTA
jgi:hypothetical protein